MGAESARNVIFGPLLNPPAAGGPSLENPGIRMLCSVGPASMVGFIKAVDENFGGAKGYLTKELGFSEGDVDVIVANLKAEPEVLAN